MSPKLLFWEGCPKPTTDSHAFAYCMLSSRKRFSSCHACITSTWQKVSVIFVLNYSTTMTYSTLHMLNIDWFVQYINRIIEFNQSPWYIGTWQFATMVLSWVANVLNDDVKKLRSWKSITIWEGLKTTTPKRYHWRQLWYCFTLNWRLKYHTQSCNILRIVTSWLQITSNLISLRVV